MVSSTILSPRGWKSPEAMRCHDSLPSSPPSPSISQTSPIQVQAAARRPSAKKSKPPRRIHDFQGLFMGTVRMSTAKPPLSAPGLHSVRSFSFQRAGPPFVRGARSEGCAAASRPAAYFSRFAAGPFQIESLSRSRALPGAGESLRRSCEASGCQSAESPLLLPERLTRVTSSESSAPPGLPARAAISPPPSFRP